MTKHSVQLIDVAATATFACDPDVTMNEIRQFVADAIAAKLDWEEQMEQWGGKRRRFYYNGDCARDPHLDRE